MRKYLNINLKTRTIETKELHGEDLVKVGRYFIAKTLVELGVAKVDPLSPQNPLIFSAGPLAGTTFSSANRTSVGCKSPLTGGIKEANGGGIFSYALGQLYIAGFTLFESSESWVIIHIQKDGSITFDDASALMGKGNFEAAKNLYEKYGKKIGIALCGPVGEYLGLLAGIAFNDSDGRPARLAARGGVGAVMGSKKVKAVVVDLDKVPQLHDKKKSSDNLREYTRKMLDDKTVTDFYRALGTMGMADVINHIGGLPVRNFTSGQFANTSAGEELKMGASYIGPLNTSRGGEQSHACMPGCVIQCSNVFKDANGREVVSPVEYETLGLLGTNCGIGDPDQLAVLNEIANDLGIDTIETGAMLGVLMDVGVASFGDVEWMKSALDEIRRGTEKGKLWAQGTARVGVHYKSNRVPVIKKQAISAYDPRVIEATGVSMMVSAQGADHTVGNMPRLKTRTMTDEEIFAASLKAQITSAAQDSLGMCVFGRTINDKEVELIADMVNNATGSSLTSELYMQLGSDVLRYELEFNKQAGFTVEDDELPAFFYTEALAPTNHVARFHASDVQGTPKQA